MKTTRPTELCNHNFELTDDDLEQVSGGFVPQPDPPGRTYIQKTTGPLLPGIKKPDPIAQIGVDKAG